MDRALRNVNDVAASESNRDSGYPELNNLQLATEVQKLNGYNHFSSSTSNLLEEVVRRLMYSQGAVVELNRSGWHQFSNDPLDQPVTPGSTITLRDLGEAEVTVHLDPRKHLKKSAYPDMAEQLKEKGISAPEVFLDKLKACYNVTAICKHASPNVNIVFYWLKNGSIYWTWSA